MCLSLYFRLLTVLSADWNLAIAISDAQCIWVSSDGYIVLIFTINTFLMGPAEYATNDYVDRDLDKYVRRTQDRPITAG